MKIPFSIDYRPQIQRGEYKVVTGDDRPVRIISWDKKVFDGRTEIVGLVPTPQGDTETVQLYCPDGTLIASGRNEKFKLFIITPELELTEFEQKVRGCVKKNLATHIKDVNGREMSSTVFIDDDKAKKMAAELLDLARKEIIDGWSVELRDTQDFSGKAYNDGYRLGFEIGYDKGKDETLKDLPRWRKWKNGTCGNGSGTPIAIVKRWIKGYKLVDSLGVHGEQYIMLKDLEKLPKED